MTRTALALASVFLLSSCDLFEPPPIECEEQYLTAYLAAVADRGQCAWGEMMWRVSHAPKTVKKLSATGELEGMPDDTLVNAPVRLVAAASSLVCAGVECSGAAASTAEARIDNFGQLTYEVFMPDGIVVGAGAEGEFGGIAVTESYGPGNDCNTNFKFTIKCEKPEETQ